MLVACFYLNKCLSCSMCSTVLYCTVLYCTVLYCIVLYCTVLYCTILYCTVLYCTVLYCTVLYCTVLYCTILTAYSNLNVIQRFLLLLLLNTCVIKSISIMTYQTHPQEQEQEEEEVQTVKSSPAPPSISLDTTSTSPSTSAPVSRAVECYRLSDGMRMGRFRCPQSAIRFIEGRAGSRIMGWR